MLARERSPATVKQHLAAIRMLFDWLRVGQVLPLDPTSSVRGPKHVVKRGKTPLLSAKKTQTLLDGIDVSTLAGLRDGAFLGVLVYDFARESAAVSLRDADYYTQGRGSFFRLREKGGRYNVVLAHHAMQAYVDAYIKAARLGEDRQGALFRTGSGGTSPPAPPSSRITCERRARSTRSSESTSEPLVATVLSRPRK